MTYFYKRLLQQLTGRDRQIAYALAGRVENRIRYCCGDSGDADLANAARTYVVDVWVGFTDEANFDLRHVGVDLHVIVGKRAGCETLVASILNSFFHQRHGRGAYRMSRH